jgi:hypothetical protein
MAGEGVRVSIELGAREDSIAGDPDRVGSRAMNTLEWRRWERVSKTNQWKR